MRKVTFKDDKLVKILEDKGVIYKEIGEINKQIVALDKERTKLGYKMDRLKEKTLPIMENLKPTLKLDEFELVSNIYLEDGKPTVEIVDQVEEYKKLLREKK